MQREFEHIVLTSFNLAGIGGAKTEEEWTAWNEHRFRIFREYCLPSMLQQSAPFTWCLFFDVTTPEKQLAEIDALKEHSFVRIYFMRGKVDFFKSHMESIRQSVPSGISWLITTRVDNDDCLHRDAIASIQSRFKPKDEYLINLSSGYTYNTASGIMSHYYYLKSPFMSLVEETGKGKLKGIFFKRHTQWEPGKAAPWGRLIRSLFAGDSSFSYMVSRPGWIQLVHEQNVSNDERRGFPVIRSVSLEPFGISGTNIPARLGMVPRYYHFIWWKRYAKGWILKVLHRLTGR